MKIDDLVIATSTPAAQRDAIVHAAKEFYQFWNTGDGSLLKAVIAPASSTTPCRPAVLKDPKVRLSPQNISARRFPT
jgi:hypothetical protein